VKLKEVFQLPYRKKPGYVDLFWLWGRVELGCIAKDAGENNPSNFDTENVGIIFPRNVDITFQTRAQKQVQHHHCTALSF
jgi:hypothetical protein